MFWLFQVLYLNWESVANEILKSNIVYLKYCSVLYCFFLTLFLLTNLQTGYSTKINLITFEINLIFYPWNNLVLKIYGAKKVLTKKNICNFKSSINYHKIVFSLFFFVLRFFLFISDQKIVVHSYVSNKTLCYMISSCSRFILTKECVFLVGTIPSTCSMGSSVSSSDCTTCFWIIK